MIASGTSNTLTEIAEKLRPGLPDDFSRLMLDGALRVLADTVTRAGAPA